MCVVWNLGSRILVVNKSSLGSRVANMKSSLTLPAVCGEEGKVWKKARWGRRQGVEKARWGRRQGGEEGMVWGSRQGVEEGKVEKRARWGRRQGGEVGKV